MPDRRPGQGRAASMHAISSDVFLFCMVLVQNGRCAIQASSYLPAWSVRVYGIWPWDERTAWAIWYNAERLFCAPACVCGILTQTITPPNDGLPISVVEAGNRHPQGFAACGSAVMVSRAGPRCPGGSGVPARWTSCAPCAADGSRIPAGQDHSSGAPKNYPACSRRAARVKPPLRCAPGWKAC